MSLKLALLKKLKHHPGKVVAQCPACAEAGGDSKGVHLVVYPDGRFGCTAYLKDKAHRRRIAQLAGDPDRRVKAWTLKLHGKNVTAGGHLLTAGGIPIASLSRSSVRGLKKTNETPSETSVAVYTDKTDACKLSTHCTGEIKGPIHVYKEVTSHASDTSEKAITAKPSETSDSTAANTSSEKSDDLMDNALVLFDAKVVAVIGPTSLVPGRFRDVLATWTPTRHHPGLKGYTPRRLSGWTKRGAPIYCQ